MQFIFYLKVWDHWEVVPHVPAASDVTLWPLRTYYFYREGSNLPTPPTALRFDPGLLSVPAH